MVRCPVFIIYIEVYCRKQHICICVLFCVQTFSFILNLLAFEIMELAKEISGK